MIHISLILLIVIVGLCLLFVCKRKSEFIKLIVIIVTFGIARALFGLGWKGLTGGDIKIISSNAFIFLLLFNFLILSILFIFGINFITNKRFVSVGWGMNGITRNILIGLTVGILLFLVLTFNKSVNYEKLPLAIFFSFLIASWQEENIFRGHLMLFLGHRFNAYESIIYQAIVYSIAHVGFYSFYPLPVFIASLIFAFIFGLIFGFLRMSTTSQIPAFVVHGMIDTAFLVI